MLAALGYFMPSLHGPTLNVCSIEEANEKIKLSKMTVESKIRFVPIYTSEII
jgi:hypothetical protein